nr:IS110 family transposase [uncultured Arsenicibacter sp.]
MLNLLTLMTPDKPTYQFFVGIDVSKATLDATLIDQQAHKIAYQQFANSPQGMTGLSQWVSQHLPQSSLRSVLYCMEHTGLYSRNLMHYLVDQQAHVWLEHPLQINQSMGLQRGKTDKADSYRIARYAHHFATQVRCLKSYDPALETLQDLLTARNRHLLALNQLKTAYQELLQLAPTSANLLSTAQQQAQAGLLESLKLIQEQIRLWVNRHHHLWQQAQLAQSIKGLGQYTVLWLMVYTRNFDAEFSARRIAALVGVAPYRHQSGSSVQKGTHTSQFAHLKLKALLHMAALNAIRFNEPLKAYYQRKVAEGKAKMLIINNVRNKLLHQLVAVIRQGKPDQMTTIPKA